MIWVPTVTRLTGPSAGEPLFDLPVDKLHLFFEIGGADLQEPLSAIHDLPEFTVPAVRRGLGKPT